MEALFSEPPCMDRVRGATGSVAYGLSGVMVEKPTWLLGLGGKEGPVMVYPLMGVP